MKTEISYKTVYELPFKGYTYSIPALELKYKEIITKDTNDSDDDDDGYYFGNYIYNPFGAVPQKPKEKIEHKDVEKTNKEFFILVDDQHEINLKIEGQEEKNKYRVFVSKKNRKTNIEDNFLCLIDSDLVKGLLNFS